MHLRWVRLSLGQARPLLELHGEFLGLRGFLNLKEDGILVKFNLEKRLKEQIANVERITEKEKQAQKDEERKLEA